MAQRAYHYPLNCKALSLSCSKFGDEAFLISGLGFLYNELLQFDKTT